MKHFDTSDFIADNAAPVLRIEVAEDSAPDQIVIPDVQLLLSAKFKKAGSDLTLTGPDGKTVVVEGYFNLIKRPDLVAPGGGGLSAELVAQLTVSETPGQYAQAGAPAGAVAIGRVERLGGSATVQHANGTVSELRIGDTIYQGDIVETRDDSQLGLSFSDGTAFNLGTNARMALSELVYTASSQSNSGVFNLVKGTMTFVAGQVAKSGDMRVVTPVSTMGIRGTTAQITVSTDAFGNTISVVYSLMADPDGNIGFFDILDNGGNVIGTVRTTDSTVVVSPSSNLTLLAQTLQKTPEIIQAELAVAQILFPIFLANPANFLQAPQDLQPKSTSPIGSSLTLPLDTPDPATSTTFIPGTISGTVTQPTAPGGVPSAPVQDFIIPPQQQQVETPTNQLPLLNIDSSNHLIEGSGDSQGVDTSSTAITKSDLNASDTVSYDTAALTADHWDNLGNGIYAKLGSYGAAALNTNGVTTSALLSDGWTSVGGNIFEKVVVLHDANGNSYEEVVRVNTTADTLTYALNNEKADPIAGGSTATDQFVVHVTDQNGGKNQSVGTFTIEGTNDAPVAHNDSYTVVLGQTLHVPSVLANDVDAEGGLSAALLNFVLHSDAGLTLVGGTTDTLDTDFNPPGWTNPDGIGAGSTIHVFGSQGPTGQGLVLTGPALVTFTFLGSEAGYSNAFYFDGEQLFTNTGDPVGAWIGDLGADAGLLDFLIRSITPGNHDAHNGGPIDPSVLLGFSLVGNNRAYAFFDDSAPGDSDFDDFVVRIDVKPAVQTSDGILSFNTDGSFDFKPFFAGTATFTYKVSDGTADSTATVTIEVPNSPDTYDFSSSAADTQVVLSEMPGFKNVTGGLGNDTITGTNSGGILNGGAGSDVIHGGTGNDVLIGGSGNDQLTGNGGDDYFVFRLGFGHDTITDFSVGDAAHHDVLDLRGLGFSSLQDLLNSIDDGANAVIHAGADTITLLSVNKDMLASNPSAILLA